MTKTDYDYTKTASGTGLFSCHFNVLSQCCVLRLPFKAKTSNQVLAQRLQKQSNVHPHCYCILL